MLRYLLYTKILVFRLGQRAQLGIMKLVEPGQVSISRCQLRMMTSSITTERHFPAHPSRVTELINHRHYHTRREAIEEITEYIEISYNRQRQQAKLGFLSPAAYTRKYYAGLVAA